MEVINLSTVTPVYGGQHYLVELVAELEALRDRFNRPESPLRLIEAIFVDDSAVDDSPRILAELASLHPWLRVVTLSRNFGQHPATIAGVIHTSGDWVITLDEDLQHRPEHITQLLGRAVADGVDVVYAEPVGDVHSMAWRDLSSRLAKRGVAALTGNPMVRHFNSFRLIRGGVARASASVCGHETYFDIALSWFTDRYSVVPLPLKDERHQVAGQSGYRLGSLISHARRLMVSSQAKTLRAGAVIGLAGLLTAAGLAGRTLWQRFFDPAFVDVRGWTSLFIAIVFFGGIGCFLLGVTLEYLMNIVLQAQGKPTFFQVDRSSDGVVRRYLEAKADVVAPPGQRV